MLSLGELTYNGTGNAMGEFHDQSLITIKFKLCKIHIVAVEGYPTFCSLLMLFLGLSVWP